jgi:methyl-accepting chemotaxis protein
MNDTSQFSLHGLRCKTDKLMTGILWALVIYSLALANWYSTWAEVFLIGVPAAVIPTILTFIAPGAMLTRIAMALALIIFSALTIHQAHGMVEMHFLIFVSLAFLLQYRDWVPLVTALVAIAVHHFLFNYLQASGVGAYIFTQTGLNIVLIHAAFAIFETTVLVYLALNSQREALLAEELHEIAPHLTAINGIIDLTYRHPNATSGFAKDYNAFMEGTHAVVNGVSNASNQIGASAEEMASITTDSNKAIAQQQAEIDQVATAINEMTSTIQEVARNTSSAAEMAREASEVAATGQNVVTSNREAMNSLAAKVEHASKVIKSLEQDSNNIGTVLDVIKAIAEQTNLLALNAAIEAARAGEQGRGFAVVADEVRTLASRTQASTQEIQTMIERLQAGSRDAVQVMFEGSEQATLSVERAAQAGESFTVITEAIGGIVDMNTQIAAAAEEQSVVSEELNRSITTISQVAEQTTTAANHNANAGKELAALSTQLQNGVKKFKV